MFQQLKKWGARLLAPFVAVAAPTLSHAQATPTVFDATPYTASITGTVPGMLAIGGAVFVVVLAIKSTKWGRRAL